MQSIYLSKTVWFNVLIFLPLKSCEIIDLCSETSNFEWIGGQYFAGHCRDIGHTDALHAWSNFQLMNTQSYLSNKAKFFCFKFCHTIQSEVSQLLLVEKLHTDLSTLNLCFLFKFFFCFNKYEIENLCILRTKAYVVGVFCV